MNNKIQWINTRWLIFSLIIIFLDQISKNWVVTHLEPFQAFQIFPFFDLLLSFNTGAAWSFLDHASGWQQYLFGGIAGIMSVIIIFFLLKQAPKYILIP